MKYDIKEDCKFLNDVECPYAMNYEECEDCSTYEPEVHPSSCRCPDCYGAWADHLYEQEKDRRMMEGEE